MIDFRSLMRLFHFILLFLTFFRTHYLYVIVLKIDNSSENTFMIWILLFQWNMPILASCFIERDDCCNTQSITLWWYDLFRSCWNKLSKNSIFQRNEQTFQKTTSLRIENKVRCLFSSHFCEIDIPVLFR